MRRHGSIVPLLVFTAALSVQACSAQSSNGNDLNPYGNGQSSPPNSATNSGSSSGSASSATGSMRPGM
jgi:hypothetical protein